MLIALLNQSSYFADKLDVLTKIASAINHQQRWHVAPAWGAKSWATVLYQDASLVPDEAVRLWVLDDPDTAGALGYHDVDPSGHPYGRAFVTPTLDGGGTVSTGPNSVSVTISHEVCETALDPDVTSW